MWSAAVPRLRYSALAFILTCPAIANAQARVVPSKPADLLVFLFTGTLDPQSNFNGTAGPLGQGFGLPGENGLYAGKIRLARALADLINAQISTFPTTSASAAFHFSFDPRLGIVGAVTNSFGSSFGERALTAGRGKIGVTTSLQHTSWESFDGFNLKLGISNVGNLHAPTDTVAATLTTTTVAVGVTYGVTDRVDVGASVPIVHSSLTGTHVETFFNSDGTVFTSSFGGSASATGFGDTNLRGKIVLLRKARFQMAAAADGWLPTGDSTNLTGLGRARARVSAIGTHEYGSISPHYSVGFTFAGKGLVFQPINAVAGPVPGTVVVGFNKEQAPFDLNASNEWNYTAGFDAVVSSKATLAVDVIGRRVLNSAHLVLLDNTGQLPSMGFQPAMSYFFSSGSVNLAIGVVGAKINVAGRWLMAANLLFPLTSDGARPNPTMVFGLERAF